MNKRLIILLLANVLTFGILNFVYFFTAFGMGLASDVTKMPQQARLWIEFAAFHCLVNFVLLWRIKQFTVMGIISSFGLIAIMYLALAWHWDFF